jgi:DNA-binding HxlR family transcriptional regulator
MYPTYQACLQKVSTHKKVSVMSKPEAVKISEQMRRGELFCVQCPSRQILQHVTSRWGVLVLVALMEGTHRFSELRRKIGGVSEKMLAQTLQCLEDDGFVKRVSLPVLPPHVEYSLTPLGEEIGGKVEALADWIETNLSVILKSQQTLKRLPQINEREAL